jgi:ACR3 family arsenite transporter
MGTAASWMERRQVSLYLAAIAIGALLGSVAPSIAPGLAASINPVLGLLLFATFLGVPLVAAGRAFRDIRFVGTVLAVNFVAVPVVVWGLSRFLATEQALLFGVLLVLLTPCVDYVIVFTGIAGGAKERLLAAAPLLMLLQIVLLPLFLLLFAGPAAVAVIEVGPFAEAFAFLIAIPLIAAALIQTAARSASVRSVPSLVSRAGTAIEGVMGRMMVPLLMATLAVVIGSQISAVGAQIGQLLFVMPIFIAFLVSMVLVGLAAGRLARLDVPATRALIFSGATRNSLVVLPLALALPPPLNLAPLVVVTQTLIELLGMIVLVQVVPKLLPNRDP